MTPIVSIVTACYNSAAFIEQTIKSVLSQTYPAIEYIIMDGGSTDGTLNIIEKYKDKIARVISQPDKGQADALKKGFHLATGTYLAWLNADDYYPPDAVETAVRYLQTGKYDIVYGNRLIVDEHSKIIAQRHACPYISGLSPKGIFYGGFNIYQPTAFWTKEIYDKVGGLDPEFEFCMDNDLILKFALEKARFRFINKYLVYFRTHPTSKTNQLQIVAKKEQKILSNRAPRTKFHADFIYRNLCRLWRYSYQLIAKPGYLMFRLREKNTNHIP